MAIADGYVEGGGRIVKQMMNEVYERDYPINASFWQEGSIDKRFKAGDQNLLSLLYGDSAFYSRRRFFFNLIRRHVNMIAGYQRQHRKSMTAVPLEPKDQQLSDDWTAMSMWSERKEGYQEAASMAFECALDTGMSLMHLYQDFTEDPVSGDLYTDYVAYNNFLIDPWFRRQDLTDCAHIWRRRWVTKQQAKQLLPGRADEIDKMTPDGLRDNKFPIQAEALQGYATNLFTYDEFHWQTSRDCTIIVDTKTGETTEWEANPDDADDELEKTLAQQPWLAVKKTQKPTVDLALVMGGRVMYEGANLLGIDSYPFAPVLCYYDPDVTSYAWRNQGVVRNLRDAQYLYNRRKIIELDILESVKTSGYKYKVGAVTDERCLRDTGQGTFIPITDDHEMGDVEAIVPPGIPQSMIELSRGLADDITKISGVNEELLGAADDDKAGILSMLRQAAGLTTLQIPFDKFDYSQKLFQRIRMEAIRKNWSNGKMARILGRQPDSKIRLLNTMRFDIAVEEGLYSTTQRQMEFRQLLHLKEIGVPISNASLVRAAQLQNKQDLIKDIEQEQKAAEQQQQAEQEAQQQQANNQRMIDFAKAQVDMAKVGELQATTTEKTVRLEEIHTQAQQNKAQADLALVKSLIELEDMNLAQVKESLQMAEMIKAQRAQIIPLQQEVLQ